MADFSYEPNYVHAPSPIPSVEVTRSKNFTRRSYLTETTFVRKYELHFGDVTLEKRNLLLEHYEGQNGPYTSFIWTNPPSYVSASPIMVYYDEESSGMGYYEETPNVGGLVFNVTLYFKFFFLIDEDEDFVLIDENGVYIVTEDSFYISVL